MQTALLILTIALILFMAGGFAALFFALHSLRKDRSQNETLFKLQGQIDGLSQTFHERIQETNKSIQAQFSESLKIVRDVTEKLVKLDQTNSRIVDYASQLSNLEKILKSPKQRGLMGEYLLETMLSNVFAPAQYKMQYRFPDGNAVDAAVFVKDKVVPIDAKFSLERYEKMASESDPEKIRIFEKELRSDLKLRINETKKYIQPQCGTTDFAIMFIPAEGLYYHFLSIRPGAAEAGAESLIEYGFAQRVIITSPMTLFAYLQTIVHALHALEIEESVKDVIARIRDLGRHIERFDDDMRKLGGHLSRTVSAYNEASREFGKIDKDIVKITGKEKAIDAMMLEKPSSPQD